MFKQIKYKKVKNFITNKKQKQCNFSSKIPSFEKNNLNNLIIKEYFTEKSSTELKKIVKKAGIVLKGKERKKENMRTILIKKCIKQPALLDKLEIDLYKNRIIEKLSIIINPEVTALIGITQNSYFCLENIFSIQGGNLKKTTLRDWQQTQSFKDYLNAVSLHTQINKKDLMIKK